MHATLAEANNSCTCGDAAAEEEEEAAAAADAEAEAATEAEDMMVGAPDDDEGRDEEPTAVAPVDVMFDASVAKVGTGASRGAFAGAEVRKRLLFFVSTAVELSSESPAFPLSFRVAAAAAWLDITTSSLRTTEAMTGFGHDTAD